MKYLCLAYYNEAKFYALSQSQVNVPVSECRIHDKEPHKRGHLAFMASFAAARTSASIRPKQGNPAITDRPFAETQRTGRYFFLFLRQGI